MESDSHEINEKSSTPPISENESIDLKTKNVEETSEGAIINEVKAAEYITGFRLYTVILGVALVVFLVMLDSTIVVTAIPRITTEFHSIKDIGWYGGAYLLSSYVLRPSFLL